MRKLRMALLVALCALAFPGTAQEAAPARTNLALVPAPRDQEGPKRRFDELTRRVQAARGNVDLLFLGDSITQGWEGAGKNVWQKYYGERKALNIGIGGDRTQHVLYRLANGHIDGLNPKAVVLMIGTNNSNRDDHPPGEILEGVTAIVKKLRQELPEARILLLGIFPRGATFSDQRGKILQVNQALARLDDGQAVRFLDIGHKFIENDGSISKSVMPDFLHLSERGYEIWAESIETTLVSWLGAR